MIDTINVLDNFRKVLIESIDEIILNEVTFKRVIRKGKVVKKVKNIRGPNYRIVRKGNQVRFVRKTAQEKRKRKLAMKKAWRKGKSSRLNKAKRTIRRSKIRMKSFYRKKK
nr:MAG TPA: hypothetical protein [Caudoviricetes sp.]